jgi:hypothetical protein
MRKRSAHHDATLDVAERESGGWCARFVRADGTIVLSADGADGESALRALHELDELEDLRGG